MNKEVESMSSIKRFLTEESLSLFGDYVISSNGLKRLEYYQEFEVRKIGCNNIIQYSTFVNYKIVLHRMKQSKCIIIIPYRFLCILIIPCNVIIHRAMNNDVRVFC